LLVVLILAVAGENKRVKIFYFVATGLYGRPLKRLCGR